MSNRFIRPETIKRRARWLDEIVQISGHFGNDSTRIELELEEEYQCCGPISIVDHLRLAGVIPEYYDHDSSAEKLYSKYTDALLAIAFRHLGLNSTVLTERGDAADVEAENRDYAFVADAKAFRLSRTAKNQKDFKVDAMHGWKRGKLYAMVVCPIYQLPIRSSQIYEQAIARNVCIFTYSHLTVLIRLVEATNKATSMSILHRILKCTENLKPSQDAIKYWYQINKTMLDAHPCIADLWQDEQIANLESITAAKSEALRAVAMEQQYISQMTRAEAIRSLIQCKNFDRRNATISAVYNNTTPWSS